MVVELLIVGPASRDTGGVARYLNEQTDRLANDIETQVHDVGTLRGEGIRWTIQAVVVSLLSAIELPRRDRPDMVHIHSSHGFAFYRASVFVLYAAYIWRCPVVFHVHGSSFDEFVTEASALEAAYQSLVLDATDRVIALSPYWVNVLAERTNREKIVVLPNAVDASAYDPTYPTDSPTLAFISNHVARKGIVDFADVVDRLYERGFEFSVTIAGSGPLDHHAKRLAETYDDVTYYGYVPEKQKRALLSESSIYILPTYGEGLPIAMLEGMAGGNAVVSTTVGSIPEVINDANGRLVEPGDVDALTDEIAALLSTPERSSKLAATNREVIEECYDWNVVIDNLDELYHSLLSELQASCNEEGIEAVARP